MVNKLIVNKLYTDEEIKCLEGNWIDESYIKQPIIQSDTDVYYLNDNNEETLLLKFRKNVITDEELNIGWKSYKDLSKPSRGRGASAGLIDKTGQYWSKRVIVNDKKWMTSYLSPVGLKLKDKYDELSLDELLKKCSEHNINSTDLSRHDIIIDIIKKEGGVSKMRVNNQVSSSAIGYFDADNKMSKTPCRLTYFSKHNFDTYQKGFPFLEKIDKLYKELVPDAHERQLERANKKSHLKISDTAFSTVTINRNFRTALHRDANDFKQGFGNLTVIERGKYQGGYTVFPQFGIGINLRNNDFVVMDVHQWHSNTPMYETDEDKEFNKSLPKIYKDNPQVGTAGIYELYTRLSFVCYLREKILNCPDTIDPEYLYGISKNKN